VRGRGLWSTIATMGTQPKPIGFLSQSGLLLPKALKTQSIHNFDQNWLLPPIHTRTHSLVLPIAKAKLQGRRIRHPGCTAPSMATCESSSPSHELKLDSEREHDDCYHVTANSVTGVWDYNEAQSCR